MQNRLLVLLASGNTSITTDVDSTASVSSVKSVARSALLKQLNLSEDEIQKQEVIRVYGSNCGGPGLSDDTTVSEVCPTQDDPLLAVVPTRNVNAAFEAWAPTALLFPLQNLPARQNQAQETVPEPSSDDLLSNLLARLAASERREKEREEAEKEKEKRADLAERRRQQDKKELEDKFKKEVLKQERSALEELRLAEKRWKAKSENLTKKLDATRDTIAGLQTEMAIIQGDVEDLFYLSLIHPVFHFPTS